jgi:hypothetical protein
MDKSISLLQEYPAYILAPDVQLTKTDEEKENVEGISFKCASCGKDLVFPYFVTIGIPPSPLLIDTDIIKSLEDEKDAGKNTISQVIFQSKRSGIESKYQWIFTEQNIMSSKTRQCPDCHGEYKFPGFGNWRRRIDRVFFAVEEYQRLHTPINSAKSDYERYLISLPDRSKVNWKYFLEDDDDDDFSWVNEEESMREHLKIALDPSYESSNYPKLHEMRADLIQDKDRMIPNDQELTRWMQKYERIQFCKIFRNPKIFEEVMFNNEKKIYNTRYTEYTDIIHYSASEGNLEWEEYDI